MVGALTVSLNAANGGVSQSFRLQATFIPLKMNRCHNCPTNKTTILLIPNGFTHYSPFLNLLIIEGRYHLQTLMNIQLPYKVIYWQQNFQSTLQSLIYSFIPLNARPIKTWSHTHKYCNQSFKRFLKPKYISHTIPQLKKKKKWEKTLTSQAIDWKFQFLR
jgi:hypothetical protein